MLFNTFFKQTQRALDLLQKAQGHGSRCNCSYILTRNKKMITLKPKRLRQMVGAKTGVATHISKIESHVHSTHCHGHALQLAVGETIKAIEIRGTLDTVFELNKDN